MLTNYIEFKDSGGSAGSISYNHTDNYLATKVNGAERMRIDSSGKVGINTSATDGMLTIKKTGSNIFGDSAITIQSADTDQSTLALGLTGSVAYIDSTESGNGTVLPLAFATGSTEKMRIDNSGNLLIGTTTKIGGQSSGVQAAVFAAEGALQSHEASKFIMQYSSNVGRLRSYGTTAGTGEIALHTGGGGSSSDTERMRINSSGNVGIGLTNPSEKLEVSGKIKLGGMRLASNDSGRIGLNRNPDDGSTVISGLQRFQINGPYSGGDYLDFQSYNSSGTYTGSFYLNAGKVGIGTSSPYHTFDVFGAVIANGAAKSNGLFFDTTSATTGTGGGIALGGYSNGTGGAIYHFGNIQGIKENSTAGNYASAMLFSTRANGATPTERMRIDSSGNLLVAKTSGPNYNLVGIDLTPLGEIQVTGNSRIVATFNRQTTDGDIAIFRKDGSSVGSIGTNLSDLTIGTGDTGAKFVDGFDTIVPFNISTNSESDGVVSFGASANRWKDLYLTGGVYLGGTGAANKLNDYEEGTWTPSYNNGGTVTYTSQYGAYVKIGRLVHLVCRIDVNTVSGTNSYQMQIIGAPFTNNGVDEHGG